MTVTTSEILSVDGVVLNTLAKNIESLTGRLRTPGVRGSNLAIPSRHGALYTRSKTYEEGEIVLPMWVVGCDDDGEIPYFGTAKEEFRKNLDALSKVFRVRRRLVDVRWTQPDGTVRQADCEVKEAIDFSVSGTNPIGKFSVVLGIPESFWKDPSISFQEQPILVADANLSFENFSGSTAPMEDLTYTINGPITNPKVYSTEDGVEIEPELSFQYDGTIADGESLTVNCSTWDLEANGGLALDFTKFKHVGHARYMVLEPDELPRLRVTGSGLGANSSLSITGYRKFLVG